MNLGLRIATSRKAVFPQFLAIAVLASILPIACRSSHVDLAVENRTGAPVRLLEIDYPSASFGKDALAPGATMHYRIQVQGNGPLKVQYAASSGNTVQITGPQIAENQEGSLSIVLLPGGKADFQAHITSAR